jgi:Cu2+-exporting ATPase
MMPEDVVEVDRCSCCRVCALSRHPEDAGAEALAEDLGVADTGRHHLGDQVPSHDHGGGGGEDHSGHEGMFRKRFWVCLALSVPVLLWSETIQGWFGYTAPSFPGSDLVVPVLASVVFIYGGLPFLRMARWELRAGGPGMMTLISLAITVAYSFSMATLVWDLGDDFFWELVTLVSIMLLGHWMEMRSVRQASGALGALAQLMPDTAEVVLPDGSVEERPVDELSVNDLVLIRPGASVPADGVVVDGGSMIDEAMITGESRPVDKTAGAAVVGGTVNVGSGSIRASVSAIGDDTALAGIMKLVADAEASKSNTQLLADRAASALFYLAVTAAVITAVVWTIYFGGLDQRTIARVVTVLVIACPHALGLAIPLVVAITTEIAARNGTLIRSREAIDRAKDLNVIAVDKTGTLTEGKIGLVGVATADNVDESAALAAAAAIEGDSEHLMARAIRDAAASRSLVVPAVSDFRILKGRGVVATVEGATLHVGGPRLLQHLDIQPDSEMVGFAADAGRMGQSVVYLTSDEEAIAAFALADLIRKESKAAVSALHAMNIEVAMITGDSSDVARAVADELNIDEYHAEVLPADKDQIVADLKTQGRVVGMVGDGVNDAPALARADIGIAIGSGTDVAVQSADLVLVKSDPLDIVRIVKLSAASYGKQVQNIWWGAGYNIVMIPLAAGILAPWGFVMPPAVGAVLMSLSTIVVAVNAQLLRRTNLTIA